MTHRYGLIAGTGFDAFGGDDAGRVVETRFGAPSGPIRTLAMEAHDVLMLARHGDAIDIPPHRINYRANLAALKSLDVDCVIALNTVGVIPLRYYPGQLALPDQLIDYTWGRAHTIFDADDGNLGHVEFTEPFCPRLRAALLNAAADADVPCHDGGVYGVTQGPRLETAAEIDRYELDGVDFVGMTAMPEAAIARELDIDYACLSLIVNRAAGRADGPIHADIAASTTNARTLAMRVLKQFFAGET